MKFLLLRPGEQERKYEYDTISPLTIPPLGLLYLGATLECDGHDVELLDYYAEDISREQLKNSLISSDAVIGTQWLQGIVDRVVAETLNLIPSYK